MPADLGVHGREAWEFVWSQRWIQPERHLMPVQRYCSLVDLLAAARAELERGGMVVTGSTGQERVSPWMAEIRLLSTECRLLENELGLSPAAESRSGIPALPMASALTDLIAERAQRRAAQAGEYDDDDPRHGLRAT
jgi:P27 family predicted phage terminase small subunit